MGVLTNTELQAQVKLGLGGKTSTDTLIVQGLNVAEKVVARAFDYNELRQTPVDDDLTAEDNTYSLTDLISTAGHESYQRVHNLYALSIIDGASYFPIKGLNAREWEKKVPSHADTDREARPYLYTRYSDLNLLFWPTPSEAYTVRFSYSLWPTPIQHTAGVITVGSDPGQASAKSEIEDKDDLIVLYALMWCYSMIGNTEKAAHFFGMYKNAEKMALEDTTQVDVDQSGNNGGSAFDNYQSSAPSAEAKAGTASWDGVYSSTPHWD